MVSQCKGRPDDICRGLDAMIGHPYNEHSSCDASWCRFLKNQEAKYPSLPYGKPLTDGRLKNALYELFSSYKKHCNKLSNLGSTQGNESFNKIVASKAPKSHHYSGSASLNYRVAAGVAQKNSGQKYITTVIIVIKFYSYVMFTLSSGTYLEMISCTVIVFIFFKI